MTDSNPPGHTSSDQKNTSGADARTVVENEPVFSADLDDELIDSADSYISPARTGESGSDSASNA